MTAIYITSDHAGVGKTAVCVTLADHLSLEGKKVAMFKPFHLQYGSSDIDPDTEILKQAATVEGKSDMIWPMELVDNGDLEDISLDNVLKAFREATSGSDISIVEGLSGFDGSIGSSSRSLVENMDASVIVVIGYFPELEADYVLRAKQLFGDRLAGVVLNGVTRYKIRDVKVGLVSTIEAEGVRVLAVIPEDRRLLGVSVGQLAKHLNGKFLNLEEKKDNFVERYLVGGMILDWGVLYFERFAHKAVIVRADRPDIQMAALRTPTSCIVLTGGNPPIEYVSYEAQEEEVPLIQVETDTLTTTEALESLHEKALFDHPMKQKQFQALMSEHGNWEALYSSLGL